MTKVTIKDIAKLAGVSRGTVDRVINKRGKVAPDIQKKILQIIENVGYKKIKLGVFLHRKNILQLLFYCRHINQTHFGKAH